MRQFPTTVRVYTLLHAASYNAILEDSVPLPGLEPTRGWCAATNARIRVTVVRGIAPDNCRYYTYIQHVRALAHSNIAISFVYL